MQTDTRYIKIFQPLLMAIAQDRRRSDSMEAKAGGYGEALLQTRERIKEMNRLSSKMSKSKEAEIFYYREVWPVVFGQWFYYHKANDFLLKERSLSAERVEGLVRMEKQEMDRFFRVNWEFWCCYLGRTPNIDDQFLRSYSQNSLHDPLSMVMDTATVASYKAAWGLAFTDYRQLLDKKEAQAEPAGEGLSDFTWNCSEVDAVEFLYSFFAEKVISYRGSPADVVHMGRWFTLNFHKEIRNLYDRFKAARNRKKVRAPFMRRLLSGLERHMDQTEGKFE